MSSIASPEFYVYTLCRPPRGKQAHGKPFYVGKGKGRRVYDHEQEARSGHQCHKCKVIRKIWREGGEVQRYILFTTNIETEALAYEVETIATYGRKNLTNQTDGGDGVSNLSAESRAKIGASSKARMAIPGARARMSAIAKSRPPASAETRAKIGVASKARLASPEARAMLSARYKARRASPETRAKMSASRIGRHPTPETRAKLRAAQKRRPAISDETRARMRASQQARWGHGTMDELIAAVEAMHTSSNGD